MTITTRIIDPKIKYNKHKKTGKYETDEQHYYYIHGYCTIPFRH